MTQEQEAEKAWAELPGGRFILVDYKAALKADIQKHIDEIPEEEIDEVEAGAIAAFKIILAMIDTVKPIKK